MSGVIIKNQITLKALLLISLREKLIVTCFKC
uniref:Uncharacterized protein n=1 Tax=Anguilla anguilla TaxID=7936 RepID=A0A0E9SD42_ANGAN